ncbi:hypothetical protein QCM77_30655 [Bradyrhizobium sp. SSUT18]|uniref:hypothetical protein n=1 Tax=Bradyrhizobium sp. SSUT18 TaxID=3040602 RepID=UPI0024485F85|nr:hypothetical protein [Bradyrhizobium sp. SSUT18]MDH2404281.1 hypothetical protein [Bradyrhizobium sp. SSUT18]
MPKEFDWERGFDRNQVLGQLKGIRKSDGRSFDSAGYAFWLPVLHSAIRATRLAEPVKAKCIAASVSDPSLSLTDPDAFLNRCNQELERLSRLPKSKFVLYTTVTYSGPRLIDWIGDYSARIYWHPSSRGSFLRKARKAQEAQKFHRRANNIPREDATLCPIVVHVSAHDPLDAFETANDYVDRFRGMLNLLVNSGQSVNPFARMTAPHAVNKFRRGPFHSIHHPDGSLATETFWYEPRWAHNAPSVTFNDPPDYRRSVQRWWRTLQRNPMRDFISDALLGYCRALDLHEANTALLGIWQVLEKLMGTDRYDLLIDRLVRIFRDHADARLIAGHIRLRRNQTVHSAHSISREADAILVQAEMLAGQAIFFYLRNAGRFQSLGELHDFLDLPLDQEKLKRRQKLSEFFIQYQNRK